MRIRKQITALMAVLALLAWTDEEAWGRPGPFGPPPRPPMPPMMPRPPMAPRPMGPPMGARPPMAMGHPGLRGPVMGPIGIPRPGIAGPGGGGGPAWARGGMPIGPRPVPNIGGPGGIGTPGWARGGAPVPARPLPGMGGPGKVPGGIRGPVDVRGLGGLGTLARSSKLAGKSATSALSRQSLARQANQVRNNYNHHGAFQGNWWNRHRGAWRAAAWATAAAAAAGAAYGSGYDSGGSGDGGSAYGTPSWDDCSSYGGDNSDPVYYDYGSNVVYEGDSVYVNGDAVATQEDYARQATNIAETGRETSTTREEKWLPLGVFAMIQGEQTTSNDIFQLAVNKSGVIRGNYYNALTDTALPVYGSVDRKTQRAAWTVGDRKEPVYEAGFANLTKSETTMLVHFGKERTQQWTLVRIEQSAKSK